MPLNEHFRIVIPARYQSTRFPGKPLEQICGKEMVLHVYDKAIQSTAIEVLIATDDERIFEVASKAQANVCMTSADHITGTDRLVEVVESQQWPADTVVVNVQGDEPLIPAACIEQVAHNLHQNREAVMATLATPILSLEEYNDPNVVKVVSNKEGLAMYFSRSGIPFYRDGNHKDLCPSFRHIGIYAYRAGYLAGYSSLPECEIETAEKLEQLRVLYNGGAIHVDVAVELPGPGVDTPEQLIEVESLLARQIACQKGQ